MRRLIWVSPAVVIPVALASGSPTDTDVVASAGDAFGITLGPESIGLYNPGSIRGFSPIAAGNVRIDGLYFDLQGGMLDRLATDTRIRVELSATNFPWPAPTGIVDYTLREPKATPGVTSIIYAGPYDTYDFDLDGSEELLNNQFGIGAGISYHNDESIPGLTAHSLSLGILPTWHPNTRVSINTFWGRQNVTDAKPQATLYLLPGQELPPIPPRYFGPSWMNNDGFSQHYGMVLKADISAHWSLRLGIFHSSSDLPKSYYDLYFNTTSAGFGDHDLVVEPPQHYGSTSGEILVSHKNTWNRLRDELLFGARGRSVIAHYGGADSFDLGVTPIAHASFVPESGYVFGPTTTNHIREYSTGVSYTLEWINHIRFTAGARSDTYSNKLLDSTFGISTISLRPWLYNSSLTYLPTRNLEVFESLTRGLEDSGVAPIVAVNRGQVLGATRSSQEEVGAKYTPTPDLSVLGGIFNVEKSYFGLDNHDVFSDLGIERHRGVEFSLTGTPCSSLHVIVGALQMSPEVLAKPTPNEIIGKAPIGQPHWLGQAGLDYQLPLLPALTVDGVFSSWGRRVASVDNRIVVAGSNNLDLGARYKFTWDEHPVTLRIQILNATNSLNWGIANDGGLSRSSGRRVWAYIITDLQ